MAKTPTLNLTLTRHERAFVRLQDLLTHLAKNFDGDPTVDIQLDGWNIDIVVGHHSLFAPVRHTAYTITLAPMIALPATHLD